MEPNESLGKDVRNVYIHQNIENGNSKTAPEHDDQCTDQKLLTVNKDDKDPRSHSPYIVEDPSIVTGTPSHYNSPPIGGTTLHLRSRKFWITCSRLLDLNK